MSNFENVESLTNPIICSMCEEGLKSAEIHSCPAVLYWMGDPENTRADRYAKAIDLGFIDVEDGCNCCVECKMDCLCDEIVYDDYDYYDDEEDLWDYLPGE